MSIDTTEGTSKPVSVTLVVDSSITVSDQLYIGIRDNADGMTTDVESSNQTANSVKGAGVGGALNFIGL